MPDTTTNGSTQTTSTPNATSMSADEITAQDKFFGRKFLITFLGLITFCVIVCVKTDITGKEALDNLIWLILIGAGSIAFEDGVGKLRGK